MSKQFESAYDEIIETIDYNEAKEIVNHGCQSGVCSQYIYYADTIRFFDNYEEEITDYIITNFGNDFLVNIFQDNNCCLDMYKNDVTWCYVELICSQIVDKYEYESTTCEELSYAWTCRHSLYHYSSLYILEEYNQPRLILSLSVS